MDLGEGIELGEGGAALGPERLRPVQDLRYPPLLGQGREGTGISATTSLVIPLIVAPRARRSKCGTFVRGN